jgi:hypothetical protein
MHTKRDSNLSYEDISHGSVQVRTGSEPIHLNKSMVNIEPELANHIGPKPWSGSARNQFNLLGPEPDYGNTSVLGFEYCPIQFGFALTKVVSSHALISVVGCD